MDILDPETVVVFDHADLNTALSVDNGYIYVHMGGSFAMTAGIRIHPGKPKLFIDGIDPRDANETVHTLTDYNSNASTGCLYVNAISSIQIKFSNLNMIGRNYYGMPCIHDLAGNESVRVEYQDITYRGPQIIWHPRGVTSFVNSNITIEQGYSAPHEVAEVSHLEIGGVSTISHNNTTTSNPAFQFYNRGGASMTILSGADVNITSVNEFFATPTPVAVTLQSRARLTLTTRQGISTGSGDRFGTFHLMANSVFRYTRQSSSGVSNALYMNGSIILESGADFMMVADFPDSAGALINFIAGTPSLQLNSPKRFALYNSGTETEAQPFYFTVPITFSFTCNQIDYWRSAKPFESAGGFDDIAPWRWHRPEWQDFSVSGTMANSATTGTVVTSTTMTQEELDLLPNFNEMQLRRAKVYAVGILPLKVNTVVGDKRPVTGTSMPDADIRVTYLAGSEPRICNARCGSGGNYVVPVDDLMPVDTSVTIAANIQFLLSDIVMQAVDAGELSISEAPGVISFAFTPVFQSPVILPRAIADAPVIIFDDRVDVDRIEWVLWVKTDGPLRTAAGAELPDSVVFIRKEETQPVTLTETFASVHTAGPYQDTLFSIIWDNTEGVLARITAPIAVGEVYTAHLTWTVLPIGVVPEEEGR